MQIPAGWLVDRFDVKWVFAAGFFLWSAATAITGFLHGFAALIDDPRDSGPRGISRLSRLWQNPVRPLPESRRGFANCDVIAGLALGPALGMLVGGTRGRPFWMAAVFCRAWAWRLCCGSPRGWRGCRAGQRSLALACRSGQACSTFCGNGPRGARAWDSPPSTTICISW